MRLLGKASLTINVKRSNGQAVADADVTIEQLDFPKRTDSGRAIGGTITFQGLSEGQFVVKAVDRNGFTNGGRKAVRIEQDAQVVNLDVFLFDATGTIAGQVTRDDAQQGTATVPNAEVVLTNASGPVAFAVTDAQGQFSVDLVPTGAVTIEAFDPVSAGRGRGTVTVLGSAQPATITVRLEALGVIRGTLLQSGVLTPLPGWTVELRQVTPAGRSLPLQVTQTGVDGGFTFPGASVGTFSLHAKHRTVSAVAQASGQLARGGELVEVPLVATIDRRLTGRVTGHVVTGGGAAAANAQVEICPSGEACRSTVADAAGRFEQGDLPLGRFFVRAAEQVTGNPSAGSAGGTLLFEGDVADVTVALLGLSTVEGTVLQVVNGAQQLAANASVQLAGQPGSGCAGACVQSTDAQGRFRFTNVPARSFTVTASNQAGQRGSVGDLLTPGESKSGLQIVLAAAVSVSGRVLDSGGIPAAGVVAEFIRGNARLFVETGADGRFEFSAIQPGAFTLALADPVGPGLARRAGTVVDVPLQLGDIVLDAAAPAVVDASPANGALGVSETPEIRVRFSEAVNASTVNANHVTLVGPGGPVTGLVDLVESNAVARFRLLPGVSLQDQARYTVRVTGVTDLVGRTMANDFVATFTTLDLTPPSITDATPTASATGVAITSTIRVRYSEVIDPAKFAGPAIAVTGPSGAIAGRIDVILGNSTVVFSPQFPLLENATYQVQVLPATDLTGRQQASGLTFSFSTTDRTPPAITSLVPSSPTVIENTSVQVVATASVTDVAFVDFFVNGTLAFTARSTPFAMALQASPAFGGPRCQAGDRRPGHRHLGQPRRRAGEGPRGRPRRPVADAAYRRAAGRRGLGRQRRARGRAGARDRRRGRHADRLPGAPHRGAGRTGDPRRADADVRGRASTARSASPSPCRVNAAPGSLLAIEVNARDTSGRTQSAPVAQVRVLDAVGPDRADHRAVLRPARAARPGGDGRRLGQRPRWRGPHRLLDHGRGGAQRAARRRAPTDARGHVVPVHGAGQRAVDRPRDPERLRARRFGQPHRRVAGDLAPRRQRRADGDVAHRHRYARPGARRPGHDRGRGRATTSASSQVTLSGAGAFGFSDSRTFTSATATASANFDVAVPAGTAIPGATLTLTARATDASGNTSAPALLTLTARVVGNLTLPESLLLRAGESRAIDVDARRPGPGRRRHRHAVEQCEPPLPPSRRA